MTSSQTSKHPPTAEELNERYQNGLTELVEKKKLGLLTQDQYDKMHSELVVSIFGKNEGA